MPGTGASSSVIPAGLFLATKAAGKYDSKVPIVESKPSTNDEVKKSKRKREMVRSIT